MASELWKLDGADAPTRLYLGPKDMVVETIPWNLHLDYSGNVRLTGLQILEANPTFIGGELFWEKLDGPKSELAVTPIVRAFDQAGKLVGRTAIEFPFPAEYIPPGDIFKDSFQIQFNSFPNSWVWLDVSLAEDFALPVNTQGKPTSSIITSVNIDDFPASSLIADETSPQLVVKFVELAGSSYQSGQMIPLQFRSQVQNSLANEVTLAINLLGPTGQSAVQAQYSIQLTAQPGNDTFCFFIPNTVTDGTYQLEVKLTPSSVGNLLDSNNQPVKSLSVPIDISMNTSATSNKASICHLIKADFPRRYKPSTPQHPFETSLTPEIKLMGYDLSIIPQAGSALARVVLHWHVQANVTQNYLVSVQLLDAGRQAVIDYTGIPVHQTRPTSTWLEDEWIVDEHLFQIPPLSTGDYQLTLSLLDEQTGQLIENSQDYPRTTLEKITIP